MNTQEYACSYSSTFFCNNTIDKLSRYTYNTRTSRSCFHNYDTSVYTCNESKTQRSTPKISSIINYFMSERIPLKHYQSSKWQPLSIDVSSIVDPLVSMVERILTIQNWLERLITNKCNPLTFQEIAWIKNSDLYRMELRSYDNNIKRYLQSILDAKVPLAWENTYSLIEKQLSPSQIRTLNKLLDLNVDSHRIWLTRESRRLILDALEEKIGNRPNFVGPKRSINE